MNRWNNFTSGFVRENPTFATYLGICSVLAVSTSLNNAIGMGFSVTAVLIVSNILISTIRKITPDDIRIPVYIVVIATLVKVVEMLINAYAGTLAETLGLFIPLIVVNCIILGRAEAFASKNTVIDSALDGLGMGLGYSLGLILMSAIRQLLGTGILNFSNPFNPDQMFFEWNVIPSQYTIGLFTQPAGAFLTFAVLCGLLALYNNNQEAKAAKKAKEAK